MRRTTQKHYRTINVKLIFQIRYNQICESLIHLSVIAAKAFKGVKVSIIPLKNPLYFVAQVFSSKPEEHGHLVVIFVSRR